MGLKMTVSKSAIRSVDTNSDDISRITPLALRTSIRRGDHTGTTTGFSSGYLQGNLAILPADYADEFCSSVQRTPNHAH